MALAWPANRLEGLDPAHALRVINRLERDAFPVIGQRPIVKIDAPEILDMIRLVEARGALDIARRLLRSEEHTSELQSLMRISYAVFCLKKKKTQKTHKTT